MSVYTSLFWPLLRRLEAERAHALGLDVLERAQGSKLGRALLSLLRGRAANEPVNLFGLKFPNVIGVAAGYDKDARATIGLGRLGFGHVEVGTLTPGAQRGNPKPRVFRLPQDQALINRMGFPNEGAEAAADRLQRLAPLKQELVVGVSLGKQKETSLTEAASDYCSVLRLVFPHADYVAVNISSPNTPELRQLQFGNHLKSLLAELTRENADLADRHGEQARPLFLKISPDLEWKELDQILETAIGAGVAGIIATNTTTGRDGLRSPLAREAGGLSGRPLAARSLEVVSYICQTTSDRLPVLGVGGIFTADDAQAQLDAGACLVQLYTGLVYGGPGTAGRILRGLRPGGRQSFVA